MSLKKQNKLITIHNMRFNLELHNTQANIGHQNTPLQMQFKFMKVQKYIF